jgi:hypothetical protein
MRLVLVLVEMLTGPRTLQPDCFTLEEEDEGNLRVVRQCVDSREPSLK